MLPVQRGLLLLDQRTSRRSGMTAIALTGRDPFLRRRRAARCFVRAASDLGSRASIQVSLSRLTANIWHAGLRDARCRSVVSCGASGRAAKAHRERCHDTEDDGAEMKHEQVPALV